MFSISLKCRLPGWPMVAVVASRSFPYCVRDRQDGYCGRKQRIAPSRVANYIHLHVFISTCTYQSRQNIEKTCLTYLMTGTWSWIECYMQVGYMEVESGKERYREISQISIRGQNTKYEYQNSWSRTQSRGPLERDPPTRITDTLIGERALVILPSRCPASVQRRTRRMGRLI